MSVLIKNTLLLQTLIFLLSACSPQENEHTDEFYGEESYEHISANRVIEVVGSDIAGNKKISEWNEAIIRKVRDGDLEAYHDPTLQEPLDPENLEAIMVIETRHQVIEDMRKPENATDSIARHEKGAADVFSYRIADSLTFNNEYNAYSASIYAISPVIHLDRHPGEAVKKAAFWIPIEEMYETFGKDETRALQDYFFHWFNPNP